MAAVPTDVAVNYEFIPWYANRQAIADVDEAASKFPEPWGEVIVSWAEEIPAPGAGNNQLVRIRPTMQPTFSYMFPFASMQIERLAGDTTAFAIPDSINFQIQSGVGQISEYVRFNCGAENSRLNDARPNKVYIAGQGDIPKLMIRPEAQMGVRMKIEFYNPTSGDTAFNCAGQIRMLQWDVNQSFTMAANYPSLVR